MQYGYFDNEKREYVIDNVALPCSWTNYLGVEDMAAVINHTAGGYLFYKTPEYHRISRFRGNGVPMDRPGFYVYLRDNEKKDYHSISWQSVAKDLSKAKYRCRHGLSYTVYESEYDGLASSQTMVIPRGENVLLWDVKVKNTTDAVRDISLFTYMEFSFHHIMIDNQNFQMSLYCAGSSYEDGIIEEDLFYAASLRRIYSTRKKGISILPSASHRTATTASGKNSSESMATKTIRQAWKKELWEAPRNWAAITAAAYRKTLNCSPAKKSAS